MKFTTTAVNWTTLIYSYRLSWINWAQRLTWEIVAAVIGFLLNIDLGLIEDWIFSGECYLVQNPSRLAIKIFSYYSLLNNHLLITFNNNIVYFK